MGKIDYAGIVEDVWNKGYRRDNDYLTNVSLVKRNVREHAYRFDRTEDALANLPLCLAALSLIVGIVLYTLYEHGDEGVKNICNVLMVVLFFVLVAMLLGICTAGCLINRILNIKYDKNCDKAVDDWYAGGYRDSRWFNGLSDDGKAHVIGVLESKAYRILHNKVVRLEPDDDSDMKRMHLAAQILDEEIGENRTIIETGFADGDDYDDLCSTVEEYERYSSMLKSRDRFKQLPLFPAGNSDLDSSDIEKIQEAIDIYNRQVKALEPNANRLHGYREMMQKYRNVLIHNPGYNHGAPGNKAIHDAETIAYAGFTV